MSDKFRTFVRTLRYDFTEEKPPCEEPIIVEQVSGGFFEESYKSKYLCPTKEQLAKFHEYGKEQGYRDYNGRHYFVNWNYKIIR